MIRVLLITALIALPAGALAQGTVAGAERPESGTVTFLDLEGGTLELNGVQYQISAGATKLPKVETGQMVTVHFTRAGNAKMVTDIIVEVQDY